MESLWYVDDLLDWDKRLTKALLVEEPKTYSAAYYYLFAGAGYSPQLAIDLLRNPRPLS